MIFNHSYSPCQTIEKEPMDRCSHETQQVSTAFFAAKETVAQLRVSSILSLLQQRKNNKNKKAEMATTLPHTNLPFLYLFNVWSLLSVSKWYLCFPCLVLRWGSWGPEGILGQMMGRWNVYTLCLLVNYVYKNFPVTKIISRACHSKQKKLSYMSYNYLLIELSFWFERKITLPGTAQR